MLSFSFRGYFWLILAEKSDKKAKNEVFDALVYYPRETFSLNALIFIDLP